MNKPFEVCLLPVLPLPESIWENNGKGRQQTGIDSGNSREVLLTIGAKQ
jgi:hypothetical protein